MRVTDLMDESRVRSELDLEVTGFAIDHRKVARGNVFGAFRGAKFDGESVIPAAVEAGAVAVVARAQATVSGAVHLTDDDPRRLFARLAARFYGPYPEAVVAVTGTNGKTSTVELLRQIWRMTGRTSASIGTLGVTTAREQVRTGLTTPDIVTFLTNMSGLAREGVTHAAFEASSHGLSQYRTEGLPVGAAVFTNLSRDHLDYHGDMESYFAAKLRLFNEVVADDGTAVVWSDSGTWSERVIAASRARGLNVATVGKSGETIHLTDWRATPTGQQLTVVIEGEERRIALPLIGAYQAANALCAAAAVRATGGAWKDVLTALERVQPVRGRMERAVMTLAGAPIYVDYAHTPDALEAAIAALRPHVTGRLIVVFGAGGDRDAGKRPAMGEVAAKGADLVIVTDDNPRSEDPAMIRAAIADGAPDAIEIADRREAIAHAAAEARSDDIVLLAGKGHETGQQIGDRVIPFDDVEVARDCVRAVQEGTR